MPYTHLADLTSAVDITKDATVSRTIHRDDNLKAVLFGFDAGQELSEHTAARAAVLHVLSGQARITLGDDSIQAEAGTWIHLPPRTPHSIVAETPLVMLLLLLAPAQAETQR